MNDTKQVAAQKRLQQMRRNGSKSPVEALKAVRESLVGRIVVRDIRRAAMHMPRSATKVDTSAWIKDEWS